MASDPQFCAFMTRRAFGGVMVAATLALTLSACGDDRFPDYHYKMTIYVDTPEGEKAFSSVRALTKTEGVTIQDSSGRRVDRKLVGQAVVLDLPDGPVFALLARPDTGDFGLGADYGSYIADFAIGPHVPGPAPDPRSDTLANATDQLADDAEAAQRIAAFKGAVDLPRTRSNPDIYRRDKPQALWPLFVRFGDIADPKTVEEVSPDSIGVKRITIEITGEPVTVGIEKRLGWLATIHGGLLDGGAIMRSQGTLPNKIGGGDFVIGEPR